MENIKHIISLLINKQVDGELTPKGFVYRIQYFPQKDVMYYVTETGFFVNDLYCETLEKAMMIVEDLGINKDSQYWMFEWYPSWDNGTFAVINKNTERLLFCGGFDKRGKLNFEDKILPPFEHTKLIKKELRAYHRKGLFVAL